jgi:L-asparaginase
VIVLVFTGGTISMRHSPDAGGAVPALSGRDIVAMAPGIERYAEFEVDDFGAFPSPHMTVDRVWALRARLLQHLARPDVDGIVIAHGTDSMEESAYLVARSVRTDKPVVFTGAMRTSSDLGWDGPANLAGAVITAASPDAHGLGAMVVMSDYVFSALEVAKVHTHAVDAFTSPGFGPLGMVDDGRLVLYRVPRTHQAPLMPEQPTQPVDIVYAYAGADSRLLDAVCATARGVVVAAMGRGNVPPAMARGIDQCLAGGLPVVITSRTGHGRVGPTYGYEGGGRRLFEAGALPGGDRRPTQARIDLMLALGAGIDLRTVFDG